MRWLILGLLSLGMTEPGRAQEGQIKATQSRDARIQAIRDEARKAYLEYQKSQVAVSDNEQRANLEREFMRATMRRTAGWSERALVVAKENLRDAFGVECLVLALQLAPPGAKSATEASKLIRELHRADPKIEPVFLRMLRNANGFDVPFLRGALAENPSEEVKALARFGLAMALKEEASVQGIKEENAKAKLHEARRALETLDEEFGHVQVKVPPLKIGNMVESEIRNIDAKLAGEKTQEHGERGKKADTIKKDGDR